MFVCMFVCTDPRIAVTARKLGIDFAPAVTGWNVYKGGSCPLVEGIVVCQEHESMLLDVRVFVFSVHALSAYVRFPR